MKPRHLLFIGLLSFLLLFTYSCKDEHEPTVDPNIPTGEFDTKNISIEIPSEAGIDLATAEIFSFGNSFPVSSNGASLVVSTPNVPSLAYLFDQEDNLLLAGFITDSTSTLSPKTTAQVLVYLGMALDFRDERLTPIFLEQYSSLPKTSIWDSEFEELWKSDPLILGKETYLDPLTEVLNGILPEDNYSDIFARTQIEKASTIQVEGISIKSGIQVFDPSIGQLSIRNSYRRRAHAFLYKMYTKDEAGNKNVLLSEVGTGTQSDIDFEVSPADAANSITGILGATIESKENDFVYKETTPIDLNLPDGVSEIGYKVHVIGPGIADPKPKTETETAKLTRLEIEAFALDFMFPLVMEIFGWKDELKGAGFDIKSGTVEAFIEKTEVFLKASPDIYENVKKGDFSGAINTFLLKSSTNILENSFPDLANAAFDLMVDRADQSGYELPQFDYDKVDDVMKKSAKIMKVVNVTLLAGDFIRLAWDYRNSNQLEEWDVRAKSSKVTLSPQESTISAYSYVDLEPIIKDLTIEDGTHPYFVFETPGEFGEVRNADGDKGKKIETATPKITYITQVSAANLPDEYNVEYVYVEAYYKNKLIGRDTASITIRKSNYQLLPKGVTLSGKEGNVNMVDVSIEPIIRNQSLMDFSEMKIVWETSGKHGKFLYEGNYSNIVNTFGTNNLKYRCLDSDTQNGTETITAKIYAKSEVDDEYFLYQTLETTLKILNDDKYKILHLPIDYYSYYNYKPDELYSSCGSNTYFTTPPIEGAESYQARVLYYWPDVIPSQVGRSISWTSESMELIDGRYEFFHLLVSGRSWPSWMGDGAAECAEGEERAKSYQGMAELIVKLK
ncbi:hypothetical protein [Algoriphagus zhangzhouensis]|uniref:Uncharacterized protein n=1 Tax=Algoriphagus zhangzhouensis TaxID=1073327 RepID=A0A1M7Z5B6_9BACT|nr:hypothetical protein [Algoriphagus zhangzhouensis]TDY48863.1 hypothetical protein A8938_0552 [Algoriphagus zhangzhouensis]SHO60071.1 hypothetical protein SAMN04488108_0552 [Algoriphagus zhangzhouensis]